MDHDPIAIKRKIKNLAKSKKMTLKDIYSFFGIGQAGFDKYMKSENLPYSKRIYEIANFLGCTVETILEGTEAINVIKATSSTQVYNNSIDNNNFFMHEKGELIMLRAENDFLKKIVEKQEKEIEFLRNQLSK